MEPLSGETIHQLLDTVKPWLDPEQAFICDLAKTDWNARLVIAAALIESGKENEAVLMLESMAQASPCEDPGQESARIKALVELAGIRMEEMKYDEAERLLWDARKGYQASLSLDFHREDISLMIAQCRFGQGFIRDAIERAEAVLHKLKTMDDKGTLETRTHQLLGWFYLHKTDVSNALHHIRQAMSLAPSLDQQLVDEGLKAEQSGDFEKAVACYFDSIQF